VIFGMNLADELSNNQNLVVVLGKGGYNKAILELNKQISKLSKTTCYITASKPAATLVEQFQKDGIDLSNYFFVDMVSQKANINPLQAEQYVSISSPSALTELGIALSKVIESSPLPKASGGKKIGVFFLDSISSMLLYNEEVVLLKFLHFLINKVRASKTKAVYVVFEADLKRELIKEIEVFADKIMEYDLPK